MHHIVQGAAKSWTYLSNFHFTKPLRFGVMYHAVLNYWKSADDFEDSILWASLVAQLVKNPPEMQETLVQSLSWEDPLKKGKATHSSILAWRIPVHGLYSP